MTVNGVELDIKDEINFNKHVEGGNVFIAQPLHQASM